MNTWKPIENKVGYLAYKPMKKLTTSALLFLLVQAAFADGLVTHSSQSAQYVRMLSRNASTGIDAVYYNPAGLTKLENGLHVAIYNQFLFGTKTDSSGFNYFNDAVFTEKLQQILIPSGFAVYKMNNWALSLGFGQTASLGSVNYDPGLPSLEIPVSELRSKLPALVRFGYDINGYDAGIAFTGSSVFWGIQPGVTYKANEFLSVYGGLRILPARNNYKGSVTDIRLIIGEESVDAPAWMTSKSGAYEDLAEEQHDRSVTLSNSATSVQQIITLGAGNYTIAQVQNAGYITSATRAAYESQLASLGFTPAQIAAMNMNQVKNHFSTKADLYNTMSATSAFAATRLLEVAAMAADKQLQTEQAGLGLTPVFGVNITPFENLNIGLRYEMKTRIKLTNNTVKDDFGLFPDKGEFTVEIPAVLGIGIGYKPVDKIEVQFSFTNYFDKGADWGLNFRDRLVYPGVDSMIRERGIDKNSFEIGLGLEFNVTGNLSFSLGGSWFRSGVADSYQSDFSFSNSSFSAGAGIGLELLPGLKLDAGFSYTGFTESRAHFSDPQINNGYSDVFGRTGMRFGVGLAYRVGK